MGLLYLARAADSPPKGSIETGPSVGLRLLVSSFHPPATPHCHYLAVACIYNPNHLPIRVQPFLGLWGLLDLRSWLSFFAAGSNPRIPAAKARPTHPLD
jgi:hypothetical protein